MPSYRTDGAVVHPLAQPPVAGDPRLEGEGGGGPEQPVDSLDRVERAEVAEHPRGARRGGAGGVGRRHEGVSDRPLPRVGEERRVPLQHEVRDADDRVDRRRPAREPARPEAAQRGVGAARAPVRPQQRHAGAEQVVVVERVDDGHAGAARRLPDARADSRQVARVNDVRLGPGDRVLELAPRPREDVSRMVRTAAGARSRASRCRAARAGARPGPCSPPGRQPGRGPRRRAPRVPPRARRRSARRRRTPGRCRAR